MSLLQKAKDLVSKLLEKPKHLLLTVVLKKAVLRAVQAAVSLLMAHNLDKVGVQVQVDPEAVAVAIMGVLEAVRNYLKQKFPKFGSVL